MDERPRTGEEGGSLYETYSTRSASTSSRATVNGPRPRPKGPRTSDISRSSLAERANLPLSPLSKEVPIVSEEPHYISVTSSTPALPPKQEDILLISPKPSRRSVARFSFRRSKSKSRQHEEAYTDDPFRAIPHSSVRRTDSMQQAQFSTDSVDLSAQPKRSLSLMAPVSRIEATLPSKPKRSFFRRMADKFTRSPSTPSPKSDFQKDRTERSVKYPTSLSYTASPTIFVSSQFSTPASPTQSPPFVPPSLFVVRPDELSSVHSHEDSMTRTPPLVRLPESVSVRSLPVIGADDQTVDNITFNRLETPTRIPSLNSYLYHMPSHSKSWQPVAPITPLTTAHTPGSNILGDPTYHTHTSISEHSSPKLGNVQTPLPSKEKAVSMRNIPVMQSTPVSEKRKAMSVRSRTTDLPRTFSLSSREFQEGERYSKFNKRYNICEDSEVLVNLDKAMFEKELVRETEEKAPKRGKSAPTKAPTEESIEPNTTRFPYPNATRSLMGRVPKRPSNDTLNDRKHLRSRPIKPSSAPNPSSPGPQRGLAFSVNLETNSEMNIPLNALCIDPSSPKIDRLYPDILYTASQSDGHLSGMPNHGSSRQFSPMQRTSEYRSQPPRLANEDSSQKYIVNGRDKVSRWLASTSQSAELDGSATSSFTSPGPGFTPPNELEERTTEYGDKKKGKAPVRLYYKV